MTVALEVDAEHTTAKVRCLATDGASSDASGDASFSLSEVSTACSSAATVCNSSQHRRTASAPPSLADGSAVGFPVAGQDVGTLLLQAFQLRDDYMALQEAAHEKICSLQAQLQDAYAEVHILRSQCPGAHQQMSLQSGGRCTTFLRGFFSAWSRQCLKNQAERAAYANLEELHRPKNVKKVSFIVWLRQQHLTLDCWRAWAAAAASTEEHARCSVEGYGSQHDNFINQLDRRQPSITGSLCQAALRTIRSTDSDDPVKRRWPRELPITRQNGDGHVEASEDELPMARQNGDVQERLSQVATSTPPPVVILTADGTATDPRKLLPRAATSRTPPVRSPRAPEVLTPPPPSYFRSSRAAVPNAVPSAVVTQPLSKVASLPSLCKNGAPQKQQPA